MMRIVSLEGKEKFVQYQKIFGFGEKTGIDLPGEASGLIYQASNMDLWRPTHLDRTITVRWCRWQPDMRP